MVKVDVKSRDKHLESEGVLQAFIFNRNLDNHSKTNNMRFKNLTRVYDFLQVQGINRDHSTKDDYF
jgi:3-methyladenine DNA glycosylase Tag